MNTPTKFSLALLLLGLALTSIHCGRPDKDEPPTFLSTAGVVLRTKGVPPQKNIYVLDRLESQLIALSASGVTTTVYDLTPPPGTWPQTLIPLWQNAPDTVSFVVPASDVADSVNVAYRVATLNLETGVQSEWKAVANPATAYVIDDEILFAASVNIASAAGPLTLPSDARVLPPQLQSDGFAYLTTADTLAWWQPLQGTAAWATKVGNAGATLAFANGYAAWVEPGYAVSASVSANGVGPMLRAPVEAGVAAMGFDSTQPTTLWLALADGTLTRVKPSSDGQRLCYIDNFSDGSTIGTEQFIDDGQISNPTLKVLRFDLPGCPGWTLSDKWRLEFEGVPADWNGLSLSGVTTISQIPAGQLLRPGFRFNQYSGGSYSLSSTEPLVWSPSAPNAATGVLQPLGVWFYQSERLGAFALAEAGQPVTAGGLVLTVNEGLDASDRGDRFGFIAVNGVDGFDVGLSSLGARLSTVFGPWEFFNNHALLVLDRKSGRVTIINATRSPLTDDIKRVQ